MPDYPDWQRAFRIVGVDVTLNVDITAVTVTVPISIQSSAVTLNVSVTNATLNVNVTNSTVNVNLAASAITLNVNLTASAITLNVNLTSSSITLNVAITASSVTLPVSIQASTVTLNVNLTASAITLNVNLTSSSITLNVAITASSVTFNITFTGQSVAVFDAAKWFAHSAVQVYVNGSKSVSDNAFDFVASRTVPAGKTMFVLGASFGMEAQGAPSKIVGELEVDGGIVWYLGSYRGGGLAMDTPVRATAGQVVRLYVGHYESGASKTLVGGFWGYDE